MLNIWLLKDVQWKFQFHQTKKSSAKNSKLNGTGLAHSTAGVETKIILETFDQFGNKGLGGESDNIRVELILEGEENHIVKGTVKETENGNYELSYTAPKSGQYNLNVYVNDESIENKNSLNIKDSGISDKDNSTISEIKDKIRAGDRFNFSLQAKDKHGNVRQSGGEEFETYYIDKETGEKTTIDFTDTHDGIYNGAFLPTKSGKYDLYITLNKEVLNGFPKEFIVEDTGKSRFTKINIYLW